jgi:predicted anti-sigma-YlaC factor YlaD
MERSKNLYLRGLNLLYGGLDLKYPGFVEAFRKGSLPDILAKMNKTDVPALYWSAAGGLSAFSLNPFDMELGVRIPEFYALVQRAYELYPDFNNGALDEFLFIYYSSLPEGMGGDKEKAEIHYKRALEKSNGLSAGIYVSYAQSISIPGQNYEEFKELLETALAIDINADPSNRLVNVINRQKARFLLDSAYLYFINLDSGDDWDDWD